MKIEDTYIALTGVFTILYLTGLGILRRASLDLHFYDTYYVFDVSFISLALLLVAIIDVIALKIIRFSFGQLPKLLTVAQLISTILFLQ